MWRERECAEMNRGKENLEMAMKSVMRLMAFVDGSKCDEATHALLKLLEGALGTQEAAGRQAPRQAASVQAAQREEPPRGNGARNERDSHEAKEAADKDEALRRSVAERVRRAEARRESREREQAEEEANQDRDEHEREEVVVVQMDEQEEEHGEAEVRKRGREGGDDREQAADLVKKEEKKAKREKWDSGYGELSVGREVCVSVHGLASFRDFAHCYIDGRVTRMRPERATEACVRMDALKRSHEFAVSRFRPQRGPTVGHNWVAGEDVHVLVQINAVPVWREAVLVRPDGKAGWVVSWVGKYEGHPPEEFVKTEQLRTAEP